MSSNLTASANNLQCVIGFIKNILDKLLLVHFLFGKARYRALSVKHTLLAGATTPYNYLTAAGVNIPAWEMGSEPTLISGTSPATDGVSANYGDRIASMNI